MEKLVGWLSKHGTMSFAFSLLTSDSPKQNESLSSLVLALALTEQVRLRRLAPVREKYRTSDWVKGPSDFEGENNVYKTTL